MKISDTPIKEGDYEINVEEVPDQKQKEKKSQTSDPNKMLQWEVSDHCLDRRKKVGYTPIPPFIS